MKPQQGTYLRESSSFDLLSVKIRRVSSQKGGINFIHSNENLLYFIPLPRSPIQTDFYHILHRSRDRPRYHL